MKLLSQLILRFLRIFCTRSLLRRDIIVVLYERSLFSLSLKRQNVSHFAQFMMLWNKFDWCSVLWTDECYIWMRETRNIINVTWIKNERLHENCLLSHFSKKNFFIIWDKILESTKEKLLMIWKKKSWSFITVKIYINHILQSVIVLFF